MNNPFSHPPELLARTQDHNPPTKATRDSMLLQSTDPRAWAFEFSKEFPTVSREQALTWFSMALQAGFQSGVASMSIKDDVQ